MKKLCRYIILWLGWIGCLLLATACRETIQSPHRIAGPPPLIPDYNGVTIPVEIAPLNFTIGESFEKIHAVITDGKGNKLEVQENNYIRIPEKEWQALLEKNAGDSLQVTVAIRQQGEWRQYQPFPLYVSTYPIDYALVYRLIAPGYEIYSKMGIYQRRLGDFTETALIENTLVAGSCVNCHSFRQTAPGNMSLHIRGDHGGTLLQKEGTMDMLNLKTPGTISAGVYPYWHPSGKYIAYSVNKTQQGFHSVRDERVEVVDLASDVVVYDIEANRLLSSPLLRTDDFETFPAFSPDGRSLYFCVAARQPLPAAYKEIRYNLCRIAFDPDNGTFGDRIDTLINARPIHKSISFPRPSYDGKYLMYTLSDYGNFSIWHREADLWLLDLHTGTTRPLEEVNSPDVESYHSWSSNSRWFVFSSRRGDGLYTRPYIASLDETGKATKPFLLPQRDPSAYDASLFSFNVPEFVSGPVCLDIRKAESKIKNRYRKQAQE